MFFFPPCLHRMWTRGDFFAQNTSHFLFSPTADRSEPAAAAGGDNLPGLSVCYPGSRRNRLTAADHVRRKSGHGCWYGRHPDRLHVSDRRRTWAEKTGKYHLGAVRLLFIQHRFQWKHCRASLQLRSPDCAVLDRRHENPGSSAPVCSVSAGYLSVRGDDRLLYRRQPNRHAGCRGSSRAALLRGCNHAGTYFLGWQRRRTSLPKCGFRRQRRRCSDTVLSGSAAAAGTQTFRAPDSRRISAGSDSPSTGVGGCTEIWDQYHGKSDGPPAAVPESEDCRSAGCLWLSERHGVSHPHVPCMYYIWFGRAADSGAGPVFRSRK